jgi:hypothetical protein
METVLAFLAAVLWIMFLAWIIAGIFIWIGAKLAGIQGATLFRSMMAALAATLAVWLVTAACSALPVVGTILGFLLGHLICIWILMVLFETGFARALVAWVFHFVAQILAVVIAALTFAGGILAVLGL